MVFCGRFLSFNFTSKIHPPVAGGGSSFLLFVARCAVVTVPPCIYVLSCGQALVIPVFGTHTYAFLVTEGLLHEIGKISFQAHSRLQFPHQPTGLKPEAEQPQLHLLKNFLLKYS